MEKLIKAIWFCCAIYSVIRTLIFALELIGIIGPTPPIFGLMNLIASPIFLYGWYHFYVSDNKAEKDLIDHLIE